ncbi:MAG TPA: HEPN domain-containing protein [Pirellulales bacterium]|jgi:HEPN domain-containing protein|nr:HEPN domain-containing protein [Pirellulales bacterium]
MAADPLVWRFWRVALQWQAAARLLLDGGQNSAAVYLAGYRVECTLKALVLSVLPRKKKLPMEATFRGKAGHSLEGLRDTFQKNSAGKIPKEIQHHFVRVNSWNVSLRYDASFVRPRDAHEFVASVDAIMDWARGRLG